MGSASSAPPPPEVVTNQHKITYRIERNGQDIGRHQVVVTDDGNGHFNVDIQFKIRVKFAFITAFKMDHKAHEVWTKDGDLLDLEAFTDRKSGNFEVSVLPQPEGYIVSVNGEENLIEEELTPTSFTFPAPLFTGEEKQVLLLDTLSGNLKPSTIRPMARQEVENNGQTFISDYYEITFDETGETTHRIWVDDDLTFIKLGLFTKDGHYIEYYRESMA